MRQSIYKRFSHNIYIVSIYRAFRNLAQTVQTTQNKQDKQDKLFELVGDVLGAISLFFIFYAAIVLAGMFQ